MRRLLFFLYYIKIIVLISFVCVQAEWVALNYVPFAERSLEVVVDLYHKTACHKAVITEKVLQNIIKVQSKNHQFITLYIKLTDLMLLVLYMHSEQHFLRH